MTERHSRAMKSSTVFHVFLISWIHCIIVILCSVTMVTQSTDGATANGIFNNSDAGNDSQNVKTLDAFLSINSVPCPPQNNLHFVCDRSLGDPGSTCDYRALIINKCLHQFPGLYNNSPWSLCLMDVNHCETVLNVLRNNGFINKSIENGDSETATSIIVSTDSATTRNKLTTVSSTVSSNTSPRSGISSTLTGIADKDKLTTVSSNTSRRSGTSSTLSGKPAHTTESGIPTTSSSRTTSSPSRTTSSPPRTTSSPSRTTSSPSRTTSGSANTSYISPMDDAMKTSSSGEEFPPAISYIYPILGAFVIAFEIAVLCIFSCYKKKRDQNVTSGALVLQEEVIEPETASPTKAALHPNSVYDEDKVLSEDKTIYKSYINLKYIDDTSAESTPEKSLIRT